MIADNGQNPPIDWEKIFQAASHSLVILDENFKIIAANDLTCRLTGLSREELRGKRCYEVFHHGRQASDNCPLLRMLTVGRFETVTEEMEALDGVFLVSCTPLLDEQGRLEMAVHTATDITRQKLAEQGLRRELRLNAEMAALAQKVLTVETSEELAHVTLATARRLTESPYGYVAYIDPDTGWMVSPTLTREIWDQCDIAGKEVVFKEFTGLWGWVLREGRSLLTNDPAADPRSVGTPPGHIPLGRFLCCPALAEGKVVGQIALANAPRDYDDYDLLLTERIASLYSLGLGRLLAQEALRRQEEKFSRLFQLSPAVITLTTLQEGRYLDVNDRYLSLFGYDRAEVIGRTAFELGIWPEPDERRRLVSALEERGLVRDWEARLRLKSGEIRDMLLSADVLEIGGIKCVLIVALDITERKGMEAALRKSETRYRLLAENLTDNLWTMDLDLHFTYVSPSIERQLGYTVQEALSLRPADLLTEPSLIYLQKEVEAELSREAAGVGDPFRSRVLELELRRKDGSVIWAEVKVSFLRDRDNKAIGFLGVTRDISEKKKAQAEMARLQEQLQQSQKMEAIGRLAGGIAHDFNNILTAIRGYGELALLEIEEGPIKSALTEILKAGDRAALLTRQLLAFSRKQIMELKVTDLNELIRNLEKMLRRIIGEDVELIVKLADRLWPVKVDGGQMEQVIVNLAVNARDAMAGGGKLVLETANVEITAEYCHQHADVTPGPYVMIAVSDTGAGIPAEIKDYIFEPFFTTKGRGRGTGLGLSMVYGIVKQSGGHIFVYSELGQGTTFKIYLPRTEEAPAEEQKVAKTSLPGGQETILLVEDDHDVRTTVAMMLTSLGYKVLVAAGGAEALSLLENTKEPLHLLLTDVVMPQMGGRELSARVLSIHPKAKVLYMSGYTDNAIVHHGVLDEGVNLITKPFTLDLLADKLREILSS